MVELQKCSLQDALNAVVRSIEASAQPNRIKLETHYDATIGDIFETDSRRLQQVLYNLLGNAIKFSKHEGVVELRVQHCFQDGDVLDWDSTTRNEGQLEPRLLRFVVKDYGKGIEKKDFEKIFQPFLQAGAETERIYGGSGLGLAITAKLVQALGGTISVNSEMGQWTEMFVDFPFSEEKTPLADVVSISSTLQGGMVLLVGDPNEREVVETNLLFQKYGIRSQVFQNMSELETWRRQPNDCGPMAYTETCVFLIHEDLYDHPTFQRVSADIKCALLSFGQKFSVPDVWGHYRRLTNMLPSVLMREIGDHFAAAASHLPRKSSQPDFKVAENTYQAYRVLIAEDNVVNQKVLVRILKKLGVTNVVVVGDGQKAVDKEGAETFDVVLMDMQMPIMDGIDACQLIMDRQKQFGLEMLAATKVVFVTAHALDHFKEKCQAAGGVGFISKPFRLKDVEHCFLWLQALLEGSHSETWYDCCQNNLGA